MVRRRLDLRSLRALIDFTELEELLSSHDNGDRFWILVRCAAKFFARHEVPRRGLPSGCVDDVTQDVVFHVWHATRPARAEGVERYLAWIWRVTHNAAADAARHERSVHGTESSWYGTLHVCSVLSDTDDATDSAEERVWVPNEDPMGLALAKELSEMITRAVRELPRRHREMLVCWAIDGESFEAIASRLGISDRTARREVMGAIAGLKTVLKLP